jgi:hypothetical protein
MNKNNDQLARIEPAYAIDTKWNPNLRWQIRCASAAFNGTLYPTREAAAAAIALLRRCPCGEIVAVASPHYLACPFSK